MEPDSSVYTTVYNTSQPLKIIGCFTFCTLLEIQKTIKNVKIQPLFIYNILETYSNTEEVKKSKKS